MATPVLDKSPAAEQRLGHGGPGSPGRPDGDGDGGDGRPEALEPVRFGLWLFLGTLTMLFVGFTSAYLVRRTGADWGRLAAPPILWLNTAALAASSLTTERARWRLRGWDLPGTQRWIGATALLALVFLAGQLLGWRWLAARGVFVSSNPHSSFFYVLTGLHAVHLLGGVVWLSVVWTRARRLRYTPGEDALGLFATYWHFLSGLWLYLFALLFLV